MSNKTPVGDNADECNLGGDWRKSSYSMSNGHCVVAARLAGARIGIRDSKATEGSMLRFEPGAWSIFLAQLRTLPLFKN